MSRRAAVLLAALALAACQELSPISAAKAEEAKAAPAAGEPAERPRLQPKDLPCFQCHDFEWWAKGPAFPHRKKDHREEGHCNVCHGSLGHEGAETSRAGCGECHEEEELKGFPRGGGPAPADAGAGGAGGGAPSE